MDKIKLKVLDSFKRDVGKGIVRISNHILNKLGISEGTPVEITGDSSAVYNAWRVDSSYEGQNVILMDSIARYNAKVSLSDSITIKPVKFAPAKSVTLSPVDPIKFGDDPTNYIKSKLLDKAFIKGQTLVLDIMGNTLHYVVTKVSPKGCVVIKNETKLKLSDKVVNPEDIKNIPKVSYDDIGGLKNEIDLIREMVEIPMKHPEVFERLGISAPKGILLTGPPGTGKTLLAKAVASETESEFYSIAGPEIMSKFYGESEKKIREIFEEANKNAPAVIFIDEIDSIAPKRGEGKDQTEKRIVAQLLTLMDGLKGRGHVIVMAATNRPDDIDEALRRPGRFDRELKILPPSESGREEILMIHTRGMPLAKDVDLKKLASKTLGYTGADLEVLCKEAAMKALKPYSESLKEYDVKVPTNILEKIEITMKNFKDALQFVEPSAMREVLINKPKVKWSDIGGLEKAKKELKETIELPMKHPELFKKAGIKPPKGVLLFGPPGTGKTLIAKAIANEADANFISVKGPELISKWVGESEKRIRDIFKKAKQVAPTVIFFDEFDSISKVRGGGVTDSTERMVNQLLTEIDGVEELENVTIIAATNRPDLIDDALKRPGRFEMKVEIGYPDDVAREEIFKVHTKTMPLAKDVDFKSLVKETKGWTGAEIESICREAGLNAIRRTISEGKSEDELEIKMSDFKHGLDYAKNNVRIKPKVSNK